MCISIKMYRVWGRTFTDDAGNLTRIWCPTTMHVCFLSQSCFTVKKRKKKAKLCKQLHFPHCGFHFYSFNKLTLMKNCIPIYGAHSSPILSYFLISVHSTANWMPGRSLKGSMGVLSFFISFFPPSLPATLNSFGCTNSVMGKKAQSINAVFQPALQWCP